LNTISSRTLITLPATLPNDVTEEISAAVRELDANTAVQQTATDESGVLIAF
jgi:hypothetical protein